MQNGRKPGFFETRYRFLSRQAVLRGLVDTRRASGLYKEAHDARMLVMVESVEQDMVQQLMCDRFIASIPEAKSDTYKRMIKKMFPYVILEEEEEEQTGPKTEQQVSSDRESLVSRFKELAKAGMIPGVDPNVVTEKDNKK